MPPTPPPLPRRPPQPEWPVPKLHFRVEDLEHEGSRLFFKHVDASTVLRDAIVSVYEHLYTPDTVPTKCVVFLSIKSIVAYVWLFENRVEQVRLVLRSMDGVAHAFGSDTHKEIHLSLEHIVNSKNRAGHEIRGVLTHEMVHCFQHDGNGKCPGGLIEGVAGASAFSCSNAPDVDHGVNPQTTFDSTPNSIRHTGNAQPGTSGMPATKPRATFCSGLRINMARAPFAGST
jgi:hypothetical protein